ncbi:MAG TPA: hypothetical protein VIH99_08855 [Bdellovibrionota bacterium]|jgi:hypothetical protein
MTEPVVLFKPVWALVLILLQGCVAFAIGASVLGERLLRGSQGFNRYQRSSAIIR